MAALFEGECLGKPTNPEIGGNPVRVRWEMVVVDGPHKGKKATYSGKLDDKSIKYTKRDMIAIGWKGKDTRTFINDVKNAEKVVPFTAEIASFKRDDGSVSEWTSAKFGGAKPLDPVEDFDKVNRWFDSAGDGGSGGGG